MKCAERKIIAKFVVWFGERQKSVIGAECIDSFWSSVALVNQHIDHSPMKTDAFQAPANAMECIMPL